MFFFNCGEWDKALLMATALAKARLPLGLLSLKNGLAADENGQLADGKWSHSQWIMGSITVWQLTRNNGAAVTQQ